MTDSTRVFILGAGFSKPAGMPLATEVLPMLALAASHKTTESALIPTASLAILRMEYLSALDL